MFGIMNESKRILKFLNRVSPVKSGNLKYFNLECEDLDQHLFCKSSRLVNRAISPFQVSYYPDINGDVLFLDEDSSGWKHMMNYRAKLKDMTTVVVQHGSLNCKIGFIPLYADYFMCWEECYSKLIEWGIESDRLIVFDPEPPTDLKKIEGVKSIMFLVDPLAGTQYPFDNTNLYTINDILSFVDKTLEHEPDIAIKPHPHLIEKYGSKLDKYNIVHDRADDLIYSADRIYSFKGCTTIKDAQVQGKKAILVD